MRGFGDRGGGGSEDRGGGGLRGVGSDDDDDDDTRREIDLLPTLTKRCTGTPLVPHPLVARIHNDSRDRYSTLSRERSAMLHSLSLERFATRRLVGRPSSSTRLCAPHHFHRFHIAASDGSVLVGDRSLARSPPPRAARPGLGSGTPGRRGRAECRALRPAGRHRVIDW